MYENLDFSRIPAFLAAAECLNFTEAANRMFISQSALSKSIAALEDAIGFPLFVRGNRRVSLTPEGTYLYQELSRVMGDVEGIIETARRMREGSAGSLCIASSGYLPKTPIFEKICSQFTRTFPGFELELRYMPFPELRECLIDGKSDAILYNRQDLAMLHGVHMLPLAQGSTVLLCNPEIIEAHDGEPLSIDDFRRHKFVCLDRGRFPSYCRYLLNCCSAYGFKPNITRYVSSVIEVIHYINNTNYVTILDRTIIPTAVSELSMIPVPFREGMERLDTVLAWKLDNQNQVLQSYVELAESIVGEKARII